MRRIYLGLLISVLFFQSSFLVLTKETENNEETYGFVVEGGKTYFINEDDTKATGWKKVDGAWYYFNTKGVMQKGWQKVKGTWYYLNKTTGIMKTGWLKDSNKWYYLRKSGAMATGWVKDSNKWYYLNSNGAMATGWKKVNNTWYYLENSGAMKTGWYKYKGYWYYLKGSGAMATSTATVNSKTYFFESNGKWLDFNDIYDKYAIVNKKHSVSSSYVPNYLTTPNVSRRGELLMTYDAAKALEKMFAAAKNDGVTLVGGSGYRSYATQQGTYNYWVGVYGQQTADTISARAGYSEHQTGLAIDISDASGATYLSTSFENTAEGKWLRNHAHEYGFVLRYLKGKESVTGYAYEPWHFRYIGTEYSYKIYNNGNYYTLEEYFGVAGGDY